MATNLLLGYNTIPNKASSIYSLPTVSNAIEANLSGGSRNDLFSVTGTNYPQLIEYDAGSGNGYTADHLALMRANIFQGSGADKVWLQESTAGAAQVANNGSLVAWYKAGFEMSNTSSTLTAWGDLSSNGHDFSIGTAPQFNVTTSGQNGHMTVTFNGTDDYMTVEVSPAITQTTTMFVAMKADATTSGEVFWDGYDATNQNAFYLPNGNWGLFAGSIFDTGVAADTDWHVFTLTFAGASSEIRIDGSSIGTGDAGTESFGGFYMGRNIAGSNYGAFTLGEIIVLDGAPSTTVRDQIEAYLTAYWLTAPLYSNTNFSAASLTGNRSQDFLTTFTESNARRYYMLELESTPGEESQLYLGQIDLGAWFDFGRDPIARQRIRREIPKPSSKYAPYIYEFEWEGISDSTKATFFQDIVARKDTTPITLYAPTYTDVLNDATMVHCRLVKATHRTTGSDSNRIQATFEELV